MKKQQLKNNRKEFKQLEWCNWLAKIYLKKKFFSLILIIRPHNIPQKHERVKNANVYNSNIDENKTDIYQVLWDNDNWTGGCRELSKKKITKCDYTKFENSVQQNNNKC